LFAAREEIASRVDALLAAETARHFNAIADVNGKKLTILFRQQVNFPFSILFSYSSLDIYPRHELVKASKAGNQTKQENTKQTSCSPSPIRHLNATILPKMW